MIKTAVCGANGKVGKEVVEAVQLAEDTELVAKIDINNGEYVSVKDALEHTKIDVVVDFTQPKAIFENAKYCLNNGINIVIGTTGLSEEQLAELKDLSQKNKISCFVAPNFSTGAVLMMKFAREAAKYFDNAEIIEMHHNQKKDAPSGTAIKTAELMAEENDCFTTGNCDEKETLTGARGANGKSQIRIHSVRMPGYSASQEVILGAAGQVLTIRHDTSDRACYMNGVLLAVKHVYAQKGFIYGLDNIM